MQIYSICWILKKLKGVLSVLLHTVRMSSPHRNDTLNLSTDSHSWPDRRVIRERTIQTMCVIYLLLTVGGNALILIAYKRNRNLQTVTNIFLVNLALVDLLTGVLNMPVLFITTTPGLNSLIYNSHGHICQLLLGLFVTLMMTSMVCLLGVSVERYTAVVYPFQHLKYFTKSKIILGNCLMWLFTAILGILTFTTANWNPDIYCLDAIPMYITIVNATLIVVSLLFTTAIYTKIAIVTIKHRRLITSQAVTTGAPPCADDGKLRKVLITVLGFYYLTWFMVLLTSFPSVRKALPYGEDVTNILFASNSWINSIVYAGWNKDFRNAFKRILFCK